MIIKAGTPRIEFRLSFRLISITAATKQIAADINSETIYSLY